MKIPEAEAVSEPVAAPGGRRERKRQQVRDQLYAAALDLFVSQGYEATTMEQIAETADVARATVFNHFSQKVGFLEEWGARRRARAAEILGAQNGEGLSVGDRLRRYLREMADLNVSSRAETAVLMDASARFGGLLQDRSLETELAKIVQQGCLRGETRTGVDPEQTGTMLAACYFSAVLRWVRAEPAPFDLRDRLDGALDTILYGVLAGAGEPD
ncbi:TetR/AcrR family transcriptional regulator [Streptomyces sp. NPDC051954]|uniref:TetR/AcrR family transcriptional regulator n=1 Tax=unclassified Streptomyces TaxID=2593676 RepID=UPI0034298263